MNITKDKLKQEFPNNNWFGGICEFTIKLTEFDVPGTNYRFKEHWILQLWPLFNSPKFYGTCTLKIITSHPTSGQMLTLSDIHTWDELLALLKTFGFKK